MPKLSPDSGLPLQPVEFQGVTLDVCPQTGGIWFDIGELGKLRRVSYEALKGLDALVKQGEQPASVDPSSRHCPNDNTLLIPFFYGENRAVQLEECRQCGGTWCDHVALDRLAEIVERQNPGYVPADLTPEAQQALATMNAEQQRFVARANAVSNFFGIIDYRPFWPFNWAARMGPDVDEGKPWL